MPIFLLIGVALVLFGGIGVVKNMGQRLFNLPDVEPNAQGGTFKRDYDRHFLRAADLTGVPFAMIKAHAIAESSLNPNAFRDESANRADRKGWGSRGLMQILWWPKSERWAKYGYPDSVLGFDGSMMFDPEINTEIAAKLIRDNLRACNGNVRDAVNMYNTGKKESVYQAPYGYVDKVVGYYEKLINGKVLS